MSSKKPTAAAADSTQKPAGLPMNYQEQMQKCEMGNILTYNDIPDRFGGVSKKQAKVAKTL